MVFDPHLPAAGPGPAAVRFDGGDAEAMATGAANIRGMHLLERLATRFNDAGVPLMALRGAALNATICDRPDERPMERLDLLVRPADHERATALLEVVGGDDVVVDLHTGPFREPGHARRLPVGAPWTAAEPVSIGRAVVLVPGAEDMLILLAAEAARSVDRGAAWRRDLRRWVDTRDAEIDWDRFVATVGAWRVALLVRRGLEGPRNAFEPARRAVCPPEVSRRLAGLAVSWRDRLASWQPPHPIAAVLVKLITTPLRRSSTSPRNNRATTTRAAPRWTSRATPIVTPRARADVVETSVDEHTVLLAPGSGVRCRLNPTALDVWHRCNGTMTIHEVAAELTERYEVDLHRAVDDVEQLMVTFARSRLLQSAA